MADPKAATVFNIDLAQVKERMDRDGKDRLVINEIVGDRRFTVFEIERKAGPFAADDNNNNLC